MDADGDKQFEGITTLMMYIGTNTPSGCGRRTLSRGREAVANLNHRILVGTDHDGGSSNALP